MPELNNILSLDRFLVERLPDEWNVGCYFVEALVGLVVEGRGVGGVGTVDGSPAIEHQSGHGS